MIILDTISKSLVAVLAGAVSANQPIFTVAYADTDGTAFAEASNDGTLNSATPVELVAAPASGHRRVIKSISIYNADTASVTYSLYLLNGANVRIIDKRTLTTLASKLYGFEALDPFNQGLNTGDTPTHLNMILSALTAARPIFTDGSKLFTSNTGGVLMGDGTEGRVLRRIWLSIVNGTTASTIKCESGSRWNGDINSAQDNIGKGATVGVWNLVAAGDVLKLLDTGISGNLVSLVGCEILQNASGTNILVSATVNGGFQITFTNSTTAAGVDLTTLVDTGPIWLHLTYLTSA